MPRHCGSSKKSQHLHGIYLLETWQMIRKKNILGNKQKNKQVVDAVMTINYGPTILVVRKTGLPLFLRGHCINRVSKT